MLPFLTLYLCVAKLRSLCLLSKLFTFLSHGNVLLFDNLLDILLFSWYMYGYFACKPMPSAYGAQKKVSDPEILELTGNCEFPYESWELNLGLLEEQGNN